MVFTRATGDSLYCGHSSSSRFRTLLEGKVLLGSFFSCLSVLFAAHRTCVNTVLFNVERAAFFWSVLELAHKWVMAVCKYEF